MEDQTLNQHNLASFQGRREGERARDNMSIRARQEF